MVDICSTFANALRPNFIGPIAPFLESFSLGGRTGIGAERYATVVRVGVGVLIFGPLFH